MVPHVEIFFASVVHEIQKLVHRSVITGDGPLVLFVSKTRKNLGQLDDLLYNFIFTKNITFIKKDLCVSTSETFFIQKHFDLKKNRRVPHRGRRRQDHSSPRSDRRPTLKLLLYEW